MTPPHRSGSACAGPVLHVILAVAWPASLLSGAAACSSVECSPRNARSAALIQFGDNVLVTNKLTHRRGAAGKMLSISMNSSLPKLSNISDKIANLVESAGGASESSPVKPLVGSNLWQTFQGSSLVLRVLCLPLLTLFCLGYELLFPPGAEKDIPANAGQPPKNPRLPLWDIMRFALECLVIYNHVVSSWVTEGMGLQDVLERAGRPIRMGGFAMVSGVFGSSMTADSVSKMFCYTLGTTALAVAFYLCTLSDYPMHLWYLQSLLMWRLTLTPCFYVFAELEIPSIVPMLISHVLLYFARHLQLADSLRVEPETFWYGFAFSVGLLFPVGTWTKTMLHRGSLAGAVFILACYYSDCFLTPFDPWLTDGHAPAWVFSAPMGIHGFIKDTVLACVQSVLALAALIIIAHASTLFSKIAPQSCEFVAGCGSRTLYAYVLHMWLKVGMAEGFPELYCLTQSPHSILWATGLTLWLNVVLCMRGSERLFRWMLLPYWMLDIKDWLVLRLTKSK
eukprot:TRINITY_DN31012_c0_g1_i1.p1 TRINITY_DN31012_c0_g1~~TRINITY_DN31012_c0_g1_i1.p1  ORF type:complete len:517 (+),score=49.95 TRINITY_DN31012_c0_g1_i1:25-1551(+)